MSPLQGSPVAGEIGLPPLPADAQLVALCAEFGSNDRERRRLIAALAFAHPIDQHRAARAELVRLTAERHGFIARIMAWRATTVDGLRVKAAVVRLLVSDLPAPGDARIGMADSLATDAVQVLA